MQDWYQSLKLAKRLFDQESKLVSKVVVLIISNVHVAYEKHEADIYDHALIELGIPRQNLLVIKHAQETIEQVEVAKAFISNSDRLLAISTFLHYPRVRYLCRGLNARHFAAFGIPRPKEMVTDIILDLLMPVIDWLGLREQFLTKVIKRRESGVH
jgi:hypothetical protein